MQSEPSVYTKMLLNPSSLCKNLLLTYEDILIDREAYSSHINQALPEVDMLQVFVWEKMDPEIRTLESTSQIEQAKRDLGRVSKEVRRREYESLVVDMSKLQRRLTALEIEEHILVQLLTSSELIISTSSSHCNKMLATSTMTNIQAIDQSIDTGTGQATMELLTTCDSGWSGSVTREYLNEVVSTRIKYLNQQVVYKYYKTGKCCAQVRLDIGKVN